MISKNDCLSILVKMEDNGINIDAQIRKLMSSKEIPIEILQFISKNRGMEVSNFYEVLRISHNKKKSPLYTNILKEIDNQYDVITTLSSMLTQISLYSNRMIKDGKDSSSVDLFIKQVRAEEISRVLNRYFGDGTFEDCANMIKLIKSDILVLEYIAGRRDFE